MRTLVLGIGNLLRSDDGVGVHVVQRLKKENLKADIVDAAIAGLGIIEMIGGYDKVIIVDAIMTGGKPGAIYRLSRENLPNTVHLSYSHGVDLPTALRFGEEIMREEMPKEVVVFAIEAEDIGSFDDKCTPRVKKAIPKVIELIKKEINQI